MSSVPDAEITRKLASTAPPDNETQEPAGSGWPTSLVGVVAPSVVYFDAAVEAQTVAYRAPAGIRERR